MTIKCLNCVCFVFALTFLKSSVHLRVGVELKREITWPWQTGQHLIHTPTHSLTHAHTHTHTHTLTHTHPHSHTQLLLEQHGPHIPPHTVEKKRERNEMLQQIPQCQVQHCPNNILSLTVFLTAVLHWLAPPIVNSHWPKISLCMTVKHQICSD